MWERLPPALLLLLAPLTFAPSAQAAAARASGGITLTTTKPGAPTGNRFNLDFRDPANPAGKPYAVKTIVLRLTPGGVIDTSALPQCRASDAELMAQGASACPASSRIGGGTILTDNGSPGGFPRFVTNDLANFNNAGEIIGFAESRTAPPTRVVSRSRIRGNTITFTIPPFPGNPPPDNFNAFRTFRVSSRAIVRNGRAYARTPPTCPRSGLWTGSIDFTYQDGVTQRLATRSPCRRARRRDRWAPRIRVRGVPRRRCAHRSFRARVSVYERLSRLRGARVAVDRRTIRRASRRRFTARVRAGRLRRGTHRLTVTARDSSGNRGRRVVRFRRC